MSERCPVKKVRQNGYSLARVLATATARSHSKSSEARSLSPVSFYQFLSVCGTG